MREKNDRAKKYYFTESLRSRLAKMRFFPLTVVEAPSGFGKTTAVREYLRENLPPKAREYWYTCLGEPAQAAWEGICRLMANVDAKAAADLRNMQMPTMDTLSYLEAILLRLRCPEETYLVIDNYQLVDCDMHRGLIDAFSLHGDPLLHMIFITQPLGARQQPMTHNDNVYSIGSAAFFFDRKGTASLFRMEGIRLSEEELASVFSSTEGWVSAIRLQIANFRENGSFACNACIERLVEGAIWDRLSPEERDFLLSVSILEGFTPRQAAIMFGKETLPRRLEDLLKSSDFIRYDPEENIYLMHSILQDYLRNRFYDYQPEVFRKHMLRRAGESYAAVSKYYAAAQFFLKAGDFDALLSLPFGAGDLDSQKENDLLGFLTAVAAGCPEETLCRYPRTLLLFGYQALMHGQTELYRKLCRLLALTAREGTGLPEEKRREIEGETILLESMEDFNDIRKMSEGHVRAWKTMEKPSGVISAGSPWVFGTISVLYVLWRESGQLENELRDMDRTHPYYLRLTRGHGAGANHVMRAEAMLMRGEDKEAEILCRRALYDARSRRQTGICMSAGLVLARIAILRGEEALYFAAVKDMKDCAGADTNLHVLRMMELGISLIGLMLGSGDRVAAWLRDIDSIRRTLYAPVVPYALIPYAKLLLLEKRYSELYGISSYILDLSRNKAGNARYLLPEVYLDIYLAVADSKNGNGRRALESLSRGLALALPDRVYLPFAQQGAALSPLLEKAKQSFPGRGMEALSALCRREEAGREAIKKAVFSAGSPLTPREREVALLARDRLSVREIAGRLYISEGTVRTMLNNIYNKLDVHSKSELNLVNF